MAGGLRSSKINLRKPKNLQQVCQLCLGTFVRIFRNSIASCSSSNVIQGVLPRGGFQILVERPQQPGRVFDYLRLLLIEVGISDSRRGQPQGDFSIRDLDVTGLKLRQINARLNHSVGNQDYAIPRP